MLLRKPLLATKLPRVGSRWISTKEPIVRPPTLFLYYNRLFTPSSAFGRYFPWLVFRPPQEQLRQAIQRSIGFEHGKVIEILPRASEGGAFVRVEPEPGQAEKVKEIAKTGIDRTWLFMNHRARGYEVLGKPWITDIPRSISRVVEVTPKLADEDIYELLRPYGRILQIQDGKALFFSTQDAITASFCAHRTRLPDGKEGLVRLSLVPRPSYWARVRGWLTGHPRVVIPALIALLFAVTYAIFEPVRELSIAANIKGTLASVSKYVEWARNSGQKLIIWRNNSDDEDAERKLQLNQMLNGDDVDEESNKILTNARQLKTYIDEGAPTFTVVVGPKGSGKTETLDVALGDNQYVLNIDCERLKNASDESLIRHLAHSIGYWPLFLWTNSLFKAAEIGIQGVTGQSTNITETTDQQVKRILTTASKAISRIALRGSAKENEQTYLETHPQRLPIVILNGFSGSDHTAALLAEWAGELARLQIARVVVVSEDASSYDKTLSEALPNRVFRVVNVEDAAPRAAKDHVLRLFAKLAQTPEAQASIEEFKQLGPEFLEPLGGRFTDLQSFGKRLVTGERPQAALDGLVHSAALEVSQLFLNESTSKSWSVEQSWELIKLLSKGESSQAWLSVPGTLATNSVISSSDINILESLESSGMITLRSVGGRVTGIKPSRPLYRAAFRDLINDPLVSNLMASRSATTGIKTATAKIQSAEAELERLSAITNSKEVKERFDFVAKQLSDSQAKLLQSQAELAVAVTVLKQFNWFEPSDSTSKKNKESGNSTSHNALKWFGSESGDEPKSSFV